MKKNYFLLVLFCASFLVGNAQIDWKRSEATSNLPSWAGTNNTERGMAYNPTNDHMYVVSRNGDTSIRVINAVTGEDVANIPRDASVITGGTFFLNDVEVSDNGAILAANLTTNAVNGAFKIYKWDTETSTPTLYATYNAEALRLGDYFKVAGDISGNAVIFAGGSGKLVRWIVTAGVLGAPTTITLDTNDTFNATSIVAYPETIDANPAFFVNSGGQQIRKYNADGSAAGETLAIVGGSSSDFEYFELGDQKYMAVFQYGSGEIGELGTLVNVTSGLATGGIVAVTPKLGANSNGNGAGGVGVKTEGTNTISLYTLGTNNGISGTTLLMNGNLVEESTVSNVEIQWKRAEADANMPTWAGTSNTERGMAYNPTNDHMYVVSRNGGTSIRVINAVTGEDVANIPRDEAVITGGTFFLNDVEVSDNGAILSANLTTDAVASPFKIYKWDTETSTPTVYATYNDESLRLGDYFKVAGDISKDAVIFAGDKNKLVRWIVTAGVLGTPTTITLEADGTFSNFSVVAYPETISANPAFFVNSTGQQIRKYNADGSATGETVAIVGGSSTDFEYFELGDQKYMAVFLYGSGEIGELGMLVNVTSGLSTGGIVRVTPKLGANGNGNGTGGVGVKTSDTGSITLFTLSSNNGIGGSTILFDGNLVTLSNEDISLLEANINIFPNPVNDVFQIRLTNTYENNAEVVLYDIRGSKVKSAKLTSNLQSVDISDLSKGIYLLKIINGNNQFTKKLIKE